MQNENWGVFVARPRKEIDKSQFEKLCGLQCTKEEICSFFNVTDKTLESWCKREYEEGFSEVFKQKRGVGKISLRRNQFRLAEKNANMAIWLGKQYLNQCEPMEVKKLEFELQKFERKMIENEPESDLDNTLLEALNGAAAEVWGGGDDGSKTDGCTEKENSS